MKKSILVKSLLQKKISPPNIIFGELRIDSNFFKSSKDSRVEKSNFIKNSGMYFSGCEDLIEGEYMIKHTDLYVFALLEGPYERALKTLGFQNLMVSFLRDELKINSILEKIKKEIINDILCFYNIGIHGIILGDDISSKKGVLFSTTVLNKYFLDIYKEISNHTKKLSIDIIFHCCGKIEDLILPIKACGFDGIHGFDKWSNSNCINNKYKNFIFMGGCDFYHEKNFHIVKSKIQFLKQHISMEYPHILCSSGGLIQGYDYNWVVKILNEIGDN